MANRQKSGANESHDAQGQGAASGPNAAGMPGALENAGPVGAGTAGTAGTAGREQERPVEVSREGTPQGMQPGESASASPAAQGARSGMQRGAATGRQSSPSLLPAFMTNPGLMASAFMANPFEFAELMTGEMDRIFDTFGSGGGATPLSTAAGGPRPRGGTAGTGQLGAVGRGAPQSASQGAGRSRGGLGSFTPQLEMLQRGNELVLRADLPGLRPDDVTVEVEDGVLAISGERRENEEDQRHGFYHSERRYGSFYRAVPLPEGVSEEQINASFRDGVLEVTVPLPQQQNAARARRIPVQGGSGASAAQPGAGGAPTSGDPSFTEG